MVFTIFKKDNTNFNLILKKDFINKKFESMYYKNLA